MTTTALVTGATGYIGGRLVPRLLKAGLAVRVLARSPEKLESVPWADDVEIVRGDLTDPGSLDAACAGIDVLYYLVHAMGSADRHGPSFEEIEEASARNVAHAAKAAGVGRIVYLGGLHPAGESLSPHLRSRARTGNILMDSGVPTAVLQAGVVIGSGSASFEMIRHLTEVLPYMPAPRWVRNRIQPIAVRDVLYYLVHAAGLPDDVSRTFDIGGPRDYRYDELMNGYAAVAGLKKRGITALPVLTPWLAAQWVNLVTPIPRSLATPIISSLQHDCVVRERDIDDFIHRPEGGLTSYPEAVGLALARMRDGEVETSWRNGQLAAMPSDPLPSDPEWSGHTVYTDLRERETRESPDHVWRVVEGIGGANGWYSFPLAWAVRGWMDKLAGGAGLRRGRRDAATLHAGDALDFWRVERIDRGRLLRLRAEMRLPGRAWLEMRVEPGDDGGARYTQRAIYFPRGLAGRAYWFAILPFHGVIFNGMANRITAAAGDAPGGDSASGDRAAA